MYNSRLRRGWRLRKVSSFPHGEMVMHQLWLRRPTHPKSEISNNDKNTFYTFTSQRDTPLGMCMLLWSAATVDCVLDFFFLSLGQNTWENLQNLMFILSLASAAPGHGLLAPLLWEQIARKRDCDERLYDKKSVTFMPARKRRGTGRVRHDTRLKDTRSVS